MKRWSTAGECAAYEAGYIEGQADAIERRGKGEWLKSAESIFRPYMCSNCGCLFDVDTVMGKLTWDFCPACGARMRGELK